MRIILCVLLGYLLGSLSPAAMFSKIKKKNLRKQGTGNLGATNTMLVLGKRYGALVMLFDIAKAFVSVKLAQLIFPSFAVCGVLAGGAAVVGHIYPFYMKFKGGKGLAAFGGFILGVDPLLFLILLIIALVMMLIFNYGVAMPVSAAVLFPILYGIRNGDVASVIVVTMVSILIICKHLSNIGKAWRKEETKVRDYLKKMFHKNHE